MPTQMTAVVVGAGWAGEGHTIALRQFGVDVAAMCARNAEILREAATKLQIGEVSTDWCGTIRAVQPDIVAIATPAVLRAEVIEAACEVGAHIYCDKPLATSVDDASWFHRLALDAGVKTAYAATHRYDASVSLMRELIEQGEIGQVREIVMTVRGGFPRIVPWSWMMVRDHGGGLLHNLLPHLLGIVERIAGGETIRAVGEARVLMTRAPVVPDVHDFRIWMKKTGELTSEQAERLEWRDCDADGAFRALLRIDARGNDIGCSFVYGPGQGVTKESTGLRVYGDGGTLVADGVITFRVSIQRRGESEPEALEIPQRLKDALPPVGDDIQQKWCALAKDFVADIRGDAHDPYLTFADGWRYQQIIDAIRSGRGWTAIESELSSTA
ncbi:Gfo/Idh/MocA family oxidoreductase [Candidatus Poribacteria bacterium]|nr:Gfo/Idh/MocA family oxidoreductase [Candidatus Poribacteria bacterium]